MRSRRNRDFHEAFSKLPDRVQFRASAAYALFASDPFHESLHFKSVNNDGTLWSARVGDAYRALGWRMGDLVVWFWIGTHAEYDRMIRHR